MATDTQGAFEDGPLLSKWQRENMEAQNDGDGVAEAANLTREHYLRWMFRHAEAMDRTLDIAATALAVARDDHPEHCGTDACPMCLIDSAYEIVMGVLRDLEPSTTGHES